MELDQNRSGAAELLNLTGGRPQQQVDQDLIVSSSWSLLSSVQDHRLCGSCSLVLPLLLELNPGLLSDLMEQNLQSYQNPAGPV